VVHDLKSLSGMIKKYSYIRNDVKVFIFLLCNVRNKNLFRKYFRKIHIFYNL